MSEKLSDLPQAEAADPDGVQVALRAAHTLWSRGDTSESLRWLRRAAESASDEGADLRSLQLAKAAADLRAKLFGSGEPPHSESARGASATNDTKAAPPPSTDEAGALPARPSSAPQYVVHRPRESPRPVMGISSSSLETVLQRDTSSQREPGVQRDSHAPRDTSLQREPSSYPSAASWSADAERRAVSAPPPLPPRSLDDYEELDAEPEEESSNHVEASWSGAPAAPTWQPAERAREVLGDGRSDRNESNSRVATLPPPFSAVPPPVFGAIAAASPPPLPRHPHYDDEDGELEGASHFTALDALEEVQPAAPARARDVRSQPLPESAWDTVARSPSWDPPAPSWDTEARGASWSSPAPAFELPSADATPAKLTARVHHQAVRVSFAPDARTPGQYIVRPLREGEKPNGGERVALLVALEPGQPLV